MDGQQMVERSGSDRACEMGARRAKEKEDEGAVEGSSKIRLAVTKRMRLKTTS